MSPPALRVEALSVSFDAPVLCDLSLTVAQGEKLALLGLNGSGKTTLFQAIAGLLPSRGLIEVDGRPLSRRTVDEIRQRLGLLFNVPEDQLLLPRVLDDVALGPSRHLPRALAYERAWASLAALSLEPLAERAITTLSHGQKQRVALAGLLAQAPALLLLDEPSAALDPPARRALARELRGLACGVVVATHDLAFARQVTSRAVLLAEGRLTPISFEEAERRFEEGEG